MEGARRDHVVGISGLLGISITMRDIIRMLKRLVNSLWSGKQGRLVTWEFAKHGISSERISHGALRTVEGLQKAGYQAYVVGGAVRDLLLGKSPKDFDVATNATPEQVRRVFRRSRLIGRRFRIVHVLWGDETVEVTTFRSANVESLKMDEHGRVLLDNQWGTLKEDALRRDVTINGLYYDPIAQTVLDFHLGFKDLQRKVLRLIGVPMQRYREDPVRVLRVIRFAVRLGFTIDPATESPIKSAFPLLRNVPSIRLFDEIVKMLSGGQSMALIDWLRDRYAGVLPPLLERLVRETHTAPSAPLSSGDMSSPKNKQKDSVTKGVSAGGGLVRHLLSDMDLAWHRYNQASKEEILQLKRQQQTLHHWVSGSDTILPGTEEQLILLFAVLLWSDLLTKMDGLWQQRHQQSKKTTLRWMEIAKLTAAAESSRLGIPKRWVLPIEQIWAMQWRFAKPEANTVARLYAYTYFRLSYQMMLRLVDEGYMEVDVKKYWENIVHSPAENEPINPTLPTVLSIQSPLFETAVEETSPSFNRARLMRRGRIRRRKPSSGTQ